MHDRRLYAGGNFTTVDGQPTSCVARFDITGTPVLDPWSPRPPAADGRLRCQLDFGWRNFVFASGGLGSGGRFAAAIDTQSAAVLPWFPTYHWDLGNGWPGLDVELVGQEILVSGDFSAINGQPRAGVAKFDLTGQLLPFIADGPLYCGR